MNFPTLIIKNEEYLHFNRVSYGKKDILKEMREYKLITGGPVGTRIEIVKWFNRNELHTLYNGVFLEDNLTKSILIKKGGR